MRFAISLRFSLCLLAFAPLQACQSAQPGNEIIADGITNTASIDIPDFVMSEVVIDSTSEREGLIGNEAETWRAFLLSQVNQAGFAQQRLFVEEMNTGRVYEIQGLPLQWRGFSNLVWESDAILGFDRWSQPHYGTHYSVDVYEKKLLSAMPFTDR